MILIFRHLHQTTLFQNDVFASTVELFPGVMEPGAALPRPPLLPKIGLLCPQYGYSSALLYSELCNTVTHVPAPPGYVLLQQPFIFNIVEKQLCRKVDVELLSRQESPLEPWRPGNGHPGRQTCPFPRKKVKCLEFVANGWKMGQLPQTEHPHMMNFMISWFHDTIKWKPFYSESWTLQKTFSPLVYPPSPSACP